MLHELNSNRSRRSCRSPTEPSSWTGAHGDALIASAALRSAYLSDERLSLRLLNSDERPRGAFEPKHSRCSTCSERRVRIMQNNARVPSASQAARGPEYWVPGNSSHQDLVQLVWYDSAMPPLWTIARRRHKTTSGLQSRDVIGGIGFRKK